MFIDDFLYRQQAAFEQQRAQDLHASFIGRVLNWFRALRSLFI